MTAAYPRFTRCADDADDIIRDSANAPAAFVRTNRKHHFVRIGKSFSAVDDQRTAGENRFGFSKKMHPGALYSIEKRQGTIRINGVSMWAYCRNNINIITK